MVARQSSALALRKLILRRKNWVPIFARRAKVSARALVVARHSLVHEGAGRVTHSSNGAVRMATKKKSTRKKTVKKGARKTAKKKTTRKKSRR